MKRFVVDLSEEQRAALERLARERRITVSALILEAIDDRLRQFVTIDVIIDARAELDALGRAIRFLRSATRFSQEGLADAARLSRGYVGMLERGVASPSYIAVVAVATALGTEASELVRIAQRLRRGEPPLCTASLTDEAKPRSDEQGERAGAGERRPAS